MQMMESENRRDLPDGISVDSTTSVKSSIINIPNKVKDFWIERAFNKRQCMRYVPSSNNGERDRCSCGHHKLCHTEEASQVSVNIEQWQASKHTTALPTDAFGQIDFQGGACYATKAQYVRLDYLTSPERILQLLLHHWQLELPKLLISVHGGIANFDLQPKLKRVFNNGLIKAANTTGAWIITGGTNTGVMRHVGSALAEKSMKTRKKHIVAIGIAPWGVVHKRQDLIGRDKAADYHAAAHPKNNTAVLNSSHNYFLLADNGTEGKYGADIVLRKKLECYISHQRIHIRGEKPSKECGVPIVCVVLEGGSNTIRTVLDYLTAERPVPVVVCDGSGRAADLLAFVHKYTNEEGNLPPILKERLISTIMKTFSYNEDNAGRLFYELIMCMKQKNLITIFRMGEQCQDIDLPILTALLTSHKTSARQQLNLALSWDRVDVARSHIFTYGQEWPEGSLQYAMLDALVQNKVDFVELLLEKGVNMSKFLTIANLEQLYNTKIGSTSTLHMMLRDIRKKKMPNARVTLIEVGEVMEKLMGGAYRSRYCRRKFRSIYYTHVSKSQYTTESNAHMETEESVFPFPFSDLMIWAVLLKRQKMAKFMWRREEEALVKAIVACKLYKSLAREAIDEPLVDNEVSEELYKYAKEFQKLALDILDHSYKEDDDLANQLLTYELKTFSNQTCISLAHSANMRDFIAHPCCQNLITDMWMGGLRMNKRSTYKVLLGILVPFSIIALDFKSKEELQLLPQTVEEHIDELQEYGEDSTDEEGSEDMDGIDTNSIIEAEVPVRSLSRQTSGIFSTFRKASIFGRSSTNHGKPNASQTRRKSIRRRLSVIADRRPSSAATLNYPDHVDEVNKIVTWQSVDEPERAGEEMDSSYKPVDNSFFHNNNTILKLKELRKKHQELKLGKKVSEFYKAPVTKYWLHTLAYLIFMCLYTYLLLVRLERYYPSWNEVYVMVYIFFHGVEMIREIVISEPTKFSHKIAIFFSEKWNLMDAISIPMFWIGVVLRFQVQDYWFLVGRVVYCVNIIFWYIRILELFAISKNLGPYVVIIGKLVMDMLNFIVILLIVLMSFGVARQALRNPYREPSWESIRAVFMEPYFMLYGEVYANDIDSPCGPGTDVETCWPGRWIIPAIMSAYLLVANILLLNLLIAVFNNTFQRISQNSREIWMFQRYNLTLEYEVKPLFPPPLILISFIYLTYKWIRRRCEHQPKIKDYGLKLFLCDEDVRRLHDFEEDCVDDYFNTLDMKFESSTEERIKVTNQRVENIILKMDDINQKENQVKLSMQAMELRIANLEDLAIQSFEQAQMLNNLTLGHVAFSGDVPAGHSTTSVDQFPMDLSSSTNVALDQGTTVSPPSAAAQYRLNRTRSNSGDAAEKQHKRIRRQKAPPLFYSSDSGTSSRSNLLRRRRGKDLIPIKTTITSGVSAPDLGYRPMDISKPQSRTPESAGSLGLEPDIPHSFSATAGLPSIEETLYNTPTDETSQSLATLDKPFVEHSANSAPSELEHGFGHRKLGPVNSLPVPVLGRGFVRELDSSSRESSPRTGSQPSLMSLTSPRLYSMQSALGSQSMLTQDQLGMAFTPVKSSVRNEYSSITDTIDTSCIHNSPESSPSASFSSPNRFYFGPNMDPSDVNRFFPGRTSPEKQFIQQETRVLRNAEEHETEVIGRTMSKRMRQISVDESNSMSNLAQHIVNDLGTSSPYHMTDEPEESSDNELSSTLPANLLHKNNGFADNELNLSHSNHF